MKAHTGQRTAESLFWLLALPLKHRDAEEKGLDVVDEDRNMLYSFIKDKLSVSQSLAQVYRFDFPTFKIGTLDLLVTVGEEMTKWDPHVEATVHRLVGSLNGLLASGGGGSQSASAASAKTPAAATLIVNETSPEAYIKTFSWNAMKYRTDKSIADVAEMIMQEVQQIDNLIKAKLAAYNQSKSAISAIERKQAGSLVTKDLAPYLVAGDFIPPSEYLQTLLVVVPRPSRNAWESSYERISAMVVPRSSRLIAEEGDYCLYNVTVFKKFKDAFMAAVTDLKCTPREVAFDESHQREQSASEASMHADLRAQWTSLVRLLRTNFGEVFSAWMHLKVVRLFVESVLHYGLPPQFLGLVVKAAGTTSSSGGAGRGEKMLRQALLLHLEQLQLPGISPVDLAAAIHTGSSAETHESLEEAELWSALNMHNNDRDPFVKVELRLAI